MKSRALVIALSAAALLLPSATAAEVASGKPANRPGHSASVKPRPLPVSVASPTTLTGQPTAQPDKKLIEFGWDTPSASYLHDHLPEMQSVPFDGLTFRLTEDGKDRLKAFEAGQWTEEQLKFPLLAELPARYGRLQHNFIQLNGPAEFTKMDWFDDSQWSQINANMELFSRAVEISRAKGVLFDPEFYVDPKLSPWEFHPEQYPTKTFWEVAEMAKERGRQFISSLQSHVPDLRFLSLFFPSYQFQHSPVSIYNSPDDAPDPLMFFFNQGIVEAAGPGVELIDGHEWSYYNQSTSTFIDDHLEMRETSEWLPPETDAAWEGVQMGPGIFMDFNMGFYQEGSQQAPMSDTERLLWLQHNVYWAMQSSDQYAWFYSERMDWYKDPSKPAGVYEAVANARALVNNKAALGYDMSVTGSHASARAEVWPGSLPLQVQLPTNRRTDRPRRTVRPGEPISIRTDAPELTSATLVVDGVPVATDTKRPFFFSLRETSLGSHTAIVRGQLANGSTISSAPGPYTVAAGKIPARR